MQFVIGLIIGLVIGLLLGGSLSLTGKVVEGECTTDPDCETLYPGSGYICDTASNYCMPDPVSENIPPIQPTGECTTNPDCDSLYPGMEYICDTASETCMPDPNANIPPI